MIAIQKDCGRKKDLGPRTENRKGKKQFHLNFNFQDFTRFSHRKIGFAATNT